MPATMDEKLKAVEPIVEFLNGNDTILEFRKIWDAAYVTVGHKVLARILLGQSAEEALRINGKE